MERFQHITYLHFLWGAIPLLGLFIAYLVWRKKALNKFASAQMLSVLSPQRSTSKLVFKFILIFIAFVLFVLGIANPQVGSKSETIKRRGIDVMIALDVSNSMLAQDIKPNRLERAKLFISRFLDKLQNDRVGLVVFAGNAYMQVPLTVDYATVKMYLPLIETGMVPTQGTAIGEAVQMCNDAFIQKDQKHKALILITDGEDHDSDAEDAVKAAKEEGVKVYTIGVGEEKGAPIPVKSSNGEDFKKDEDGNVIITKFNKEMLETLSNLGGGQFYQLAGGNDIVQSLISNLDKMETKELEDSSFSEYESYFYYFLLAALVLLSVEFFISEKKLGWIDKILSTSKKTAAVLLLIIGFSTHLLAQEKNTRDVNLQIKAANKAYRKANYSAAEIGYRKALAKDSKNTTATFNLGDALYEQKKYKEAAAQFDALKTTKDSKLLASSYHNAGNSFLKDNNYEAAIKSYQEALKLNPTDMDTKYNLTYAKKKQQQQQDDKKKQQQQKDQQKQNQENKPDDKKGEGKPKDEEGNKQAKPEEGDRKDKQDKEGQGEPKPKPGEMTKEQAQKLLDALQNQEQKTQQKVQLQKAKPQDKKTEKDW